MRSMIKRLSAALIASTCFSAPAFAVSPFSQQAIQASPVTVLSTELNTLASGAAAPSTVGGSSGVFSQNNFGGSAGAGGYVWATAWFKAGGAAGGTPAVGAVINCWFLNSTDGGTTFEETDATPSTTVPALPRSADFQISFPASALIANHIYFANGYSFRLPAGSYKLLCQNMIGQALNASGNTIVVAGLGIQY